jgi:3-deoxy-manno-octulosonate cytidylyltransferase (CMP-KDO synthetase)
MAQRVLAVIPARLGSTRFSNKVIYPLNGKPLLFYVHQEMSRVAAIDKLVIATDSNEIARAAEGFGAEVVMTARKHRTGSDRVAEVAAKLGGDIILNIQADSLGLTSSTMARLVNAMKKDGKVKYATLARPIESDNELFDPNKVKVTIRPNGDALWFSRFPIPYLQNCSEKNRYRQFPFLMHIGVYAFRREALRQFASWRRSPLEKAESLEQLRILENGLTIRVVKTKIKTVSVDSPDDLNKIKHIYTVG